jgi:RNA polymerase sigma-70 factor (ECF subfamily)
MPRQGEGAPPRPIVYCLVPWDLAASLHELLRRHFRDDPKVEVVTERRRSDRRHAEDRRLADDEASFADRRLIRSLTGRRVGERRAVLACVDVPELPRRARRFADQLVFVERLEPSTQQAEDVDTARLVLRIQSGDREAFALLYMRYFDRVCGYLRVALNDADAAEDATQEVFVKLLEALPRYELRSSPFRAWLFTIVRNHLRRELQRRSRVELSEPGTLREETGCLEDAEFDAQVRALSWISDKDLLLFVERLPVAQRQVLLLRYMLDLTHEQTAAVLGRSYEDVRKLQSRALNFLRARLAAVGRAPTRSRPGMVRRRREARVLRWRRFALTP